MGILTDKAGLLAVAIGKYGDAVAAAKEKLIKKSTIGQIGGPVRLLATKYIPTPNLDLNFFNLKGARGNSGNSNYDFMAFMNGAPSASEVFYKHAITRPLVIATTSGTSASSNTAATAAAAIEVRLDGVVIFTFNFAVGAKKATVSPSGQTFNASPGSTLTMQFMSATPRGLSDIAIGICADTFIIGT